MKKAANLYDYLIANAHRYLTCGNDELLACGTVSLEESKLLSAAMDKALEAWDTFGQANFPQLKERAPYGEHDMGMMGMRSGELPDRLCVKALGDSRVGGYGIIWGSAEEPDVYGEWFTAQTEEMTAIFKAVGKLPYLYHHAMDENLRGIPIGTIDAMKQDEVGLWYEAQIEMSNAYREAFFDLTRKKRLGSSSGTLPGARSVSKTGEIVRWPVVEISATPTPADLRHLSAQPLQVMRAFTALGLDFSKAASLIGRGESDRSKQEGELLHSLWELEVLASLYQEN